MNNLVEILITLPLPETLLNRIREISPRIKVTATPARKPEDISLETWSRTEVLYTDQVLPAPSQAPRLRWIQFHYSGVDFAVKSPILQNAEIVATTMSGASASQMAEYAVMMILSLGHHMPEMMAFQSKSEWPRDRFKILSPRELRGSTVGIIGYGSIGRQIARLLQPFGPSILAAKRDVMHPEDTGYALEGMGDPGGDLFQRLYPIQALRSLLRESDFVVISLPLTEDTRNLIGARELEEMKSGAYLINISRGGIVHEPALVEALQNKRIAGAALDVFAEEPLPPTSPLWKLPNVILTPHISGSSPYYDERAVDLFTENLTRHIEGLPLYNRFDVQKGY